LAAKERRDHKEKQKIVSNNRITQTVKMHLIVTFWFSMRDSLSGRFSFIGHLRQKKSTAVLRFIADADALEARTVPDDAACYRLVLK
jgi:hypothetical protein